MKTDFSIFDKAQELFPFPVHYLPKLCLIIIKGAWHALSNYQLQINADFRCCPVASCQRNSITSKCIILAEEAFYLSKGQRELGYISFN